MGKSPGKANGNPLQYSCLENSIAFGASGITVGLVAVAEVEAVAVAGAVGLAPELMLEVLVGTGKAP